MSQIQTGTELAEKMIDMASNYNTVYALGMWGLRIEEATIAAKARQLPDWYTADRQRMLRALIGKGYWGGDCVCSIKAILWGWTGDPSSQSGGAVYASNDVPDIGANQMIAVCTDVSTDFSNILIGEVCWMEGHVGVYVGNGLSVECTPRWQNKVQFTACNRVVEGYPTRTWTKHGRLPYISYDGEQPAPGPTPTPAPAPVPQPEPTPEPMIDTRGLFVSHPITKSFTDNQWFNFICGLLAGRRVRSLGLGIERDGSAATIPQYNPDKTYFLWFVTTDDGDIDNPGHVEVYLCGTSTAPEIDLQYLTVEVSPTNPTDQIVIKISTVPQGSTLSDVFQSSNYFINHAPMSDITVDDETGLTILQEYSPAKVQTNETGAMTIIRQHNLVVEMNNTIHGTPNCQIHLFDLTCTWEHDVTLELHDPDETVVQPYLAGDIQMEAGYNSVYRYDDRMWKLQEGSIPCWLTFGDPTSEENKRLIDDLAERNPGLPAGSEIPTYPSERPKSNVSYLEYRGNYPSGPGAGRSRSGLGGPGGGWNWRRGGAGTSGGFRHRVAIPNSGTFDTTLTLITPDGEVIQDYPAETEIHVAPSAPRPRNKKYKNVKSRLSLFDEVIISIASAAAPEVSEHLTLSDDAVLTVVVPPLPPEVDEHLQLTDDANIDVYTPVYPDGNEHLNLEDTADIDVYTPPSADRNEEHLKLTEIANVNINSPTNQAEINIVI